MIDDVRRQDLPIYDQWQKDRPPPLWGARVEGTSVQPLP
jgi:hypothetical protein